MDYEKITQAAQNVDNFIKGNAAVKTILIDTSAAMFGDTSKEAKQSIQEFLDAPLGDKKEIAMKKAYAAALVVAKDRNLLPHLPNTGAAMAALIDDGLGRVKAGYLVGQGLMLAEEAIDNIFGAEKAVKTFEQGQVVIIRNGVHYNLLGMELK